MTTAELVLWNKLRYKQILGVQFYRQKPIKDYIVDFFSSSAHLVIEVDGGQHFSEEGLLNDRIRDNELRKMGLTVLRFTNDDILNNLNGTLQVIFDEISKKLRE